MDYGLLGIFLIIPIAGIFTLAIGPLFIGQANPAVLFVGLLADLALPPSSGTTTIKSMPVPVAAIIFSIVSTLIVFGYFTIFESNGRRTAGKKAMGLELHRTDGTFPTFMGAFTRNLTKIVCALIGGFLLGLVGIIIFTAIVLVLEYLLFADTKFDLRQRFTETIKGTLVLMEDEETEPGKIALPEELKKKKPEKKKKEALPPHEDRKEEIPALPEHEEEPEEREEIPEEEEEEETVEESTEEASESGEKQSFWKKLFGKKEKPSETVEEEEEIRETPKQIFERLAPARKEKDEDEIILQFMMDFDIDEDRSRGLVKMGYTDKSELRDAIPKDLMMIKGINPTIAKRIIKKANE